MSMRKFDVYERDTTGSQVILSAVSVKRSLSVCTLFGSYEVIVLNLCQVQYFWETKCSFASLYKFCINNYQISEFAMLGSSVYLGNKQLT